MSSFFATSTSIDARYSFLPHLIGRTHYHRIGPDDGPVVIMVSGATLPMAVWGPVVAPLVDAGFQVVRYDLPGRGHTPLEGLGVSFQAHLDQLHHLLEGLGIHQPVHLIGLASGALIVAAYTERNRARVSHACLIAPDGVSTRFTLAERLLTMPLLGTLLFRFTAQRTLFARVPRYSSRPDIQAFVRNLLDFSLRSPGFHEAVLATVRTFPLHHGEEQYLRLAESGVPTCVVWGREDHITPSDAAGAMGAMFGEESLRILENVGHLPFVEDPASVATLLDRHFRDAR
jgi:pimeloyl-ACP methyl ester carboxylesterase